MENLHEIVHVLYFHVYLIHEIAKRDTSRYIFHLMPPLHHYGRGSIVPRLIP